MSLCWLALQKQSNNVHVWIYSQNAPSQNLPTLVKTSPVASQNVLTIE